MDASGVLSGVLVFVPWFLYPIQAWPVSPLLVMVLDLKDSVVLSVVFQSSEEHMAQQDLARTTILREQTSLHKQLAARLTKERSVWLSPKVIPGKPLVHPKGGCFRTTDRFPPDTGSDW